MCDVERKDGEGEEQREKVEEISLKLNRKVKNGERGGDSKSKGDNNVQRETERSYIHPKSFQHRWSPDRAAVGEGQQVARTTYNSGLSSLGVGRGILCAIRRCRPSRFGVQRMRCLHCKRESVDLVGMRVGGEQFEGQGGQGKRRRWTRQEAAMDKGEEMVAWRVAACEVERRADIGSTAHELTSRGSGSTHMEYTQTDAHGAKARSHSEVGAILGQSGSRGSFPRSQRMPTLQFLERRK